MPALSALSLDGVALTPQFAAATVSYAATVGADVDEVTVAATAAAGATLVFAPADADTNTAGWQVALPAADPGGAPTQTSIAAIVTAADGMAVNAYLVTVTREAPPSADTALDTLTITGATLAPAFTANIHEYAATVANTVDEVTVAATAVHTGATVAIAPADADTVTAGWQIALVEGDNTITVTVTAADEITTADYTVIVTRDAATDDATLATLALDGVALSPAFDPATFIYTATVDADTEQVTLDLAAASTDAAVTIVPADNDPNTAGWQIPLTAVQPGGQPSTTAIAVVVTAADANTRLTYSITIARQAPSVSPITVTLPEGCRLEDLDADSDGTLTGAGRWRPKCQSMIEYHMYTLDDPVDTGNARFFRLGTLEQGDVTIRLESNTSRHIVLRSGDGTVVEHIHYNLHYPGGAPCESQFGVACSAAPVLKATLPAGTYIVELVQHYNRDGRQRDFTVTVGGAHQYSAVPQLAALTVDGTEVASIQPSVYAYELARPAAVVTLAAQAVFAPPGYLAHTVLVEPADADAQTAGHQVELVEYGLTEVTVTVTDGYGAMSNRYVVTFAGDHEATVSTGGSVSVDGSVRARIDSDGDRDWFAVTLEADKTYLLKLGGSPSGLGTLADPELFGIHGSGGVLVAGTSDADSGVGADAEAVFAPADAGEYFVSVGAGDNGTGTYVLSVVDVTDGFPDDFAGDASTTGTVTVGGGPVQGEAQFPADQDWFAVVLEAGTVYRIRLRGASSGFGTLDDPYLHGVHLSDGALIAGTTDDNSGLRSDSELFLTPDTGGTFYVSAGAVPGDRGTYELSVLEVPALAAVVPEGCEIEHFHDDVHGTLFRTRTWRPRCSSLFEYHLRSTDDALTTGFARYYRFDVIEQGEVTIQANPNETSGSQTSRHIVLRSADGTQLDHVFYHIEFAGQVGYCLRNWGFVCAQNPEMKPTLPAGQYVLEVIQHYSHDRRMRSSTVVVVRD